MASNRIEIPPMVNVNGLMVPRSVAERIARAQTNQPTPEQSPMVEINGLMVPRSVAERIARAQTNQPPRGEARTGVGAAGGGGRPPEGPPRPPVRRRPQVGVPEGSGGNGDLPFDDEEALEAQAIDKRLSGKLTKRDYWKLREELDNLLRNRISAAVPGVKGYTESALTRWFGDRGELKRLAESLGDPVILKDYAVFESMYHSIAHEENCWVAFKGPKGVSLGFEDLVGESTPLTTGAKDSDVVNLLSLPGVVSEFHKKSSGENEDGYVEDFRVGKDRPFTDAYQVVGHRLRRITGAATNEFEIKEKDMTVVTDSTTGRTLEVFDRKTGKWKEFRVPHISKSGLDYEFMRNRFPMGYMQRSYSPLYKDRDLLWEPVFEKNKDGEIKCDSSGRQIVIDYIDHADVYFYDYWMGNGMLDFWRTNIDLIGRKNIEAMGWTLPVSYYNPEKRTVVTKSLTEAYEEIGQVIKRFEAKTLSPATVEARRIIDERAILEVRRELLGKGWLPAEVQRYLDAERDYKKAGKDIDEKDKQYNELVNAGRNTEAEALLATLTPLTDKQKQKFDDLTKASSDPAERLGKNPEQRTLTDAQKRDISLLAQQIDILNDRLLKLPQAQQSLEAIAVLEGLRNDQLKLQEQMVCGVFNETTKRWEGGLRKIDIHARLDAADIAEINRKHPGLNLEGQGNPYFLDFSNPKWKELWQFKSMWSLSTFFQRQLYMRRDARDPILIIAGSQDFQEKEKMIKKLDTEYGFRHIGGVQFTKVRERKIGYIYEVLSSFYQVSFKERRHKGARFDLAKDISMAVENQGYMRDFYRTHLWEPTGIQNIHMGEVQRLGRLTPQEKMRMVLHTISEKEVLEKGLLAEWNDQLAKDRRFNGIKITYDDLLGFSGLKQVDKHDSEHIVFDWRGERVTGSEYGSKAGSKYTWAELRLSEEAMTEFLNRNQQKANAIFNLMYSPGLPWNFIYYRNFDRLRKNMFDMYLKNTWEIENKITNRQWGLDFDPWEREKYFWRIYRRQHYTLGKYTGKFINNQFTPDGNQIDTLTQAEASLAAYRQFDKEGKLPTKASDLIGEDQLDSLLMGTAELRPGDSAKISPLYIFYDTNRFMYSMFASTSAGFWWEVFKHQKATNPKFPKGMTWEQWKGYERVATPEKLGAIISILGPSGWEGIKASQAIIDPDEEIEWASRVLGPKRLDTVKKFRGKRRSFNIPNIEGRTDAQELASDQEAIQGVIKMLFETVPGADKLFPMGQVKSLSTGKQISAWVKSIAAGVGLPVAAAAGLMAMQASPLFVGLAVGAAPILGIFSAIWGADKPDRELNPASMKVRWGKFTHLISSFGLTWFLPGKNKGWGLVDPVFIQRQRERAPENLINGKNPVWDDTQDAMMWIGMFDLFRSTFGTQEKT